MNCPYCEVEFAMLVSIGRTEALSPTICHRCAQISLFTEDGGLRKMTSEEEAQNRNDPRWAAVWRIRDAIRRQITAAQN